MNFFDNLLNVVGLKKEKNQHQLLVVEGEYDFLENYNKGYFLVPLSIIDFKNSPNKRIAFNKYRNGYYKINEEYYFEEMSFYVCKNLNELNLLYKIKKVS
jgi:hypothetical protein